MVQELVLDGHRPVRDGVKGPAPASFLTRPTRGAHSGSRRTQPSRLPANLTHVPLADCGRASGLPVVHTSSVHYARCHRNSNLGCLSSTRRSAPPFPRPVPSRGGSCPLLPARGAPSPRPAACLGTQPTPRHRVLSEPRPTAPCRPSSPHRPMLVSRLGSAHPKTGRNAPRRSSRVFWKKLLCARTRHISRPERSLPRTRRPHHIRRCLGRLRWPHAPPQRPLVDRPAPTVSPLPEEPR